MSPDTYDEAAALWPFLSRYKKLCVSLLGTTIPLVIFLTSAAHSAPEIVAAAALWLATNFGVKEVTNTPAR